MMVNIFININAEVIITTHNLNDQFVYLGYFKKALKHISNKCLLVLLHVLVCLTHFTNDLRISTQVKKEALKSAKLHPPL